MSMAQYQHLYNKAGLNKDTNITESSRDLKARVAVLDLKCPKLITEIIQPLTEKEAE